MPLLRGFMAVAIAAAAVSAAAGDWPQILGPDRTGLAAADD